MANFFRTFSIFLFVCQLLLGTTSSLTPDEEVFVEDLEKRAFQFFWEHSSQTTGLTLDRAWTSGAAPANNTDNYRIASIAATGFALTSYCIAADRKWITTAAAIERTKVTLNFFANQTFNIKGWFYHWLDSETGERRWNSEISSIDTALLLGGVLTVKQCFSADYQIVRLATIIYERVDFHWMLNGHPNYLSHGWKPENGGQFLASRWTDYSEQTMLNLLAIASPTHPVSWRTWYALKRNYTEYKQYRYMAAVPPLFIHQYSHAFFDFRGRREGFESYNVDYFANSIAATHAQREFFVDVLSVKWPHYGENIWGLTASDSANGYKAWGAPPEDPDTDGTVVPCAAGGSLMFTPNVTLAALREMQRRYPSSYGLYGFADAFNPATNWTNGWVLGIDVGITLLSAENMRSGKVWTWFMANMEAQDALRLVFLKENSSTTMIPSPNTAFIIILAGYLISFVFGHRS